MSTRCFWVMQQFCCHACSMSKGVILQITIPYMSAKQKHRERTDNASGTRRSKVAKVESSMIEKEATELKHKDFIVALYLMGMHGNKAKELAYSLKHLSAIGDSTVSGCACTQAETNLYNYASVIYDVWSLEIWRKNITHRGNQRTPGMV